MVTSLRTEFDCAIEDEPKNNDVRTVSCATGYAAYDVIRGLADKTEKENPGLKINVYKIRNDFFGESITVAGLLTGKDILAQLQSEAMAGRLGDKLLLPKVCLRAEGDLFLDGMTPAELSDALGVKIEFVPNDGYELLAALKD